MFSLKIKESPECVSCGSNGHTLRCAGCRVVHYCGKEHQTQHWDKHKEECKGIRKARLEISTEEARLRALYPGEDVFVTGRGSFWRNMDMRDYMRARGGLMMILKEIDTTDAVAEALEHALEMMRLSRGDGMGIRDVTPALMLRLGKVQECYDFVKWWATTGNENSYDFGNNTLPYLDLHDQNPFESPSVITGIPDKDELVPRIACFLIRVRLLEVMRQVQAFNEGSTGKIPEEIAHPIRVETVGPGLARYLSREQLYDPSALITQLGRDTEELFKAVKRSNPHFWRHLVTPEEWLEQQPNGFQPGDISEAQLHLFNVRTAILETPTAVDLITKMSH